MSFCLMILKLSFVSTSAASSKLAPFYIAGCMSC
nr:MAG TPA: hypothetical protein [Crassvirales sp.]